MAHVRNGRVAKEQRRQDAALRLIESNERGEKAQLKRLDSRPGESLRERERLEKVK